MNKTNTQFFWLKKMRSILLFSFVINILYLTGPIFMMQVYDRVLASANIPTLIGLALITVLLYAFFGVLEYIRGQALRANSESVTESLAQKAYSIAILNACEKEPTNERRQSLHDVNMLRNFLSSQPFSALFDLPWAPIFLIFIFGLHPGLGVFALVAAIVLAGLAIINERMSREQLKKSSGMTNESNTLALDAQRNAITLRANGMIESMGQRWRDVDINARETSLKGSAINSSFSTITKTLRMIIQSLLLAAGAYYVIQGELSPGGIIASSVIFSRALAPLEQILGNYSSLVNAREAWANIKTWMFDNDTSAEKESLPAPSKSLLVQEVSVIVPNEKTVLLRNINFALKAGDVLGISGHSGCGKSTLAKALVGAFPVANGKICIDGADLPQWPRELIGQHIGYLPQEIELFAGTVAENIARFQENADFDKVLKASELAGTHQLVLSFTDGYNTRVGTEGVALSAGQKQRIALARALYDDPFLVVMDEPNSNLDAEGEKALANSVITLQKRGAIVVFVAHRQNILEKANKLLLMRKGEMIAFGNPEDIVKAMKEKNGQPSPPPAATKKAPKSKPNIMPFK